MLSKVRFRKIYCYLFFSRKISDKNIGAYFFSNNSIDNNSSEYFIPASEFFYLHMLLENTLEVLQFFRDVKYNSFYLEKNRLKT